MQIGRITSKDSDRAV